MLLPDIKPNKEQQLLIERKFGMFIHFGINTFNDTEWSDGTLPIQSYCPSCIDAEQWIRNAYMAGMNYVILITKHHDGFCLWDTKTTDYCVTTSPNPTDVVLEVSKACKKYGIKLGLYYSLWDRHEKCYSDNEKYIQYMLKHLDELTNGKYGDICEVWLDGGWEKTNDEWGIPRLYNLIKANQPDCAVGVNISIGEYNCTGFPKVKDRPRYYKENMPMRYFPCDFRLFDPHFTRKKDPKIYSHNGERYYLPFEATICIRNMKNWFWDPKYTKEKLLSTNFIVKKYRHLINQNNNLIINVAPNIYGKQEQSDIDRIIEASKKLNIYREI